MSELSQSDSGNTPHRERVRSTVDKLDYIDAVRGWAIFLVISCHVGGQFAEMPWPIKKLTNFGWHGVQLFFLASAVTLMMSWHRQSATGGTAVRNFFVRRVLRIAPMYYLGALIYFLIDPPGADFSRAQLLRSLFFINAWHPDWIPTTDGWMVVPGGWSIGVEFTFYAVFPILAATLTSMRRAFFFGFAALGAALYFNHMGASWFADYEQVAVSNFLYFWFPNQLPIFALGIFLYHVLARRGGKPYTPPQTYALIGAAGIVCVVVAEYAVGPSYFEWLAVPPPVFWAGLAFSLFIIALAKGAPTIFSNVWIRRLGELSFSAYVLHFLFVWKLPVWSHGLIDINAGGYHAIAMYVLLWVLTMATTVAASSITHRLIEKPGIDLARRLTSSRRKFADVAVVAPESAR